MSFKVIIFACYFGRLPNYFRLWLKSCGFNPQYEFLFFCDSDPDEYEIPRNVRFIRMTFAEMKKHIAKQLNTSPAVIKSPYKLTDYKVAYGDIFREYLDGADYWGYCDIDMVFGRLNNYLPALFAEGFDKIYELGHLTLYKNTEYMRKLYTMPGGAFSYKTVYSSPMFYSFDEHAGMIAISRRNKVKEFLHEDMADISCRIKRMTASRQENYRRQVFYFENGRAYRAYIDNDRVFQEEYVYIHFQKRKYTSIPDSANAYYLLSDRMIPKEEPGMPNHDRIIELSEFVSDKKDESERRAYEKRKYLEFFRSSTAKKIIWIKEKIFEKRRKMY